MFNSWNVPRGIGFRNIVVGGAGTATPVSSSWVPFGDNDSWIIVLDYAKSTVPPVIDLEQAEDASATGAKALGITEILTISAAEPNDAVEADIAEFKDTINRTTPLASFDSTAADRGGANDNKYRVVIRVDAQTLETGFSHVRVNSTGTSTARVFNATAIGVNKSYCGTP